MSLSNQYFPELKLREYGRGGVPGGRHEIVSAVLSLYVVFFLDRQAMTWHISVDSEKYFV